MAERSRASSTRSSRSSRSCARPRPPAERAEEFGDLLFVLVNVARWQGIEAEAALRAANDKFRRRFAQRRAPGRRARASRLRDLDFAGARRLWDTAKTEERAAVAAAAKETTR